MSASLLWEEGGEEVASPATTVADSDPYQVHMEEEDLEVLALEDEYQVAGDLEENGQGKAWSETSTEIEVIGDTDSDIQMCDAHEEDLEKGPRGPGEGPEQDSQFDMEFETAAWKAILEEDAQERLHQELAVLLDEGEVKEKEKKEEEKEQEKKEEETRQDLEKRSWKRKSEEDLVMEVLVLGTKSFREEVDKLEGGAEGRRIWEEEKRRQRVREEEERVEQRRIEQEAAERQVMSTLPWDPRPFVPAWCEHWSLVDMYMQNGYRPNPWNDLPPAWYLEARRRKKGGGGKGGASSSRREQ